MLDNTVNPGLWNWRHLSIQTLLHLMYTSPITARIKRQRVDEDTPRVSTPIVNGNIPSYLNSTFQTPTHSHQSLHSVTSSSNFVDFDTAKLKSEVSRLSNKVATMTVELESQKSKHQAMVDSLESRISELIKERRLLLESDADSKIKTFEKDKKQNKSESKLAQVLEAKSEECRELEEKLADALKRIKKLERAESKTTTASPQVVIASDTETTESTNSALKEEMNFIQEQLEKFVSESKSKELHETAARLVAMSSENARLKSENDYLKRINSNRLLMEEKMYTFDKRMAEFEEFKAKYVDLESLYEKQKEKVIDEEQFTKLQSRLAEYESLLEEKQALIAKLGATIELNKKQIQDLKSTLADANQSVEQCHEQISTLQKEYQLVEQERNNLREQLNH